MIDFSRLLVVARSPREVRRVLSVEIVEVFVLPARTLHRTSSTSPLPGVGAIVRQWGGNGRHSAWFMCGMAASEGAVASWWTWLQTVLCRTAPRDHLHQDILIHRLASVGHCGCFVGLGGSKLLKGVGQWPHLAARCALLSLNASWSARLRASVQLVVIWGHHVAFLIKNDPTLVLLVKNTPFPIFVWCLVG